MKFNKGDSVSVKIDLKLEDDILPKADYNLNEIVNNAMNGAKSELYRQYYKQYPKDGYDSENIVYITPGTNDIYFGPRIPEIFFEGKEF